MHKATSAAMLLILTACGGGGGEPAAQQNKISVEVKGEYIDKLRALSQDNRDLTLRRAIQDSGQTCKRINGSQENGTYENLTIWNAFCEGGKDYAVFVAPNGDVQVRPCGEVAELGLPACRKAEG